MAPEKGLRAKLHDDSTSAQVRGGALLFMPFQPINDDHAVESVLFQIVFDRGLTADALAALQSQHAEWKEDLPAQQLGQVISDDGDGPSLVPLSFSYLRPDGSPVWQLRFDQTSVAVLCTRYTRWERVWSTARSLFERVIPILAAPDASPAPGIANVRLQVVDRFKTREGEDNASNLLRRDSRYLAPAIFDKGDLWHNNTGWFEQAAAGIILHNVNVAASRVVLRADTSEIRVGITHLQEFRFTEHPLLTTGDAAIDALDKTMRRLHISNKALLSDMIVDSMQRNIGLVSADEPRESP